MGCITIPISQWEDFIKLFINSAEKNNIVGVTVSRSYKKPLNKNIYHEKLPTVKIQIRARAVLGSK